MIVAVSAFRLDTNEEGTGGFDLLAESDVPIQFDVATPDGRLELGFIRDLYRRDVGRSQFRDDLEMLRDGRRFLFSESEPARDERIFGDRPQADERDHGFGDRARS